MKKWLFYFAVIISSFFISGCFNGVVDITVNKDGSAEVIYDISVDSALLTFNSENPLEGISKTLKQNGYSISQYKENGYTGISAKKHVNKVEEVWKEGFINQIFNISESMEFESKNGFFYDSYKLNTTIKPAGNEEPEHEAEMINTAFLSSGDLKLRLALPFKPDQHNASRVIEINDKPGFNTYEWDIIYNQNNELLFEAKKYNFINIIFTVLCGLALLGVILYLILKRKTLSQRLV